MTPQHVNDPRATRSGSGGPQNEHPPPQEANVPPAYISAPTPILAALALPHVHTDYTDDLPSEPCTWCQEIGADCAFTLYWMPREDVLSDGYLRCCLDCAPERIRRAHDDALVGSLVRVEIAGGAA